MFVLCLVQRVTNSIMSVWGKSCPLIKYSIWLLTPAGSESVPQMAVFVYWVLAWNDSGDSCGQRLLEIPLNRGQRLF